MIRFIRFALGGIFFILSARIMDKRDFADICKKSLST